MSFSNAKGLKSQLGYALVMTDVKGKFNVMQDCRSKFRRISRSIMAAEVHALVLRDDYAFLVPTSVE